MNEIHARGVAIKRRRLALGIKSVNEFAKVTGIDRGAVTRAESGTASEGTLDRLEAWLDDIEQETGHDEPTAEPEPLRITMRGVYGIEEVVVEGPVDHPDELVASVARLIDELRTRG